MSVSRSPKNTLRGLPECIVALPYHLGYRPERSLVLVCLGAIEATGATSGIGTVALTARVDLPEPGHTQQVLDAIAPALRRRQTRAVILLVYLDDFRDGDFELHREGAYGGLLTTVADLSRTLGVEVWAQAQVRGQRWLSLPLGRDEDSSVTARWQQLPASPDVPGIADYVLAGRVPLADREELADLFRRSQSDLTSAAEAQYAAMCSQEASTPLPLSHVGTALRTLRDVVAAQGGSVPAHIVADDLVSLAIAVQDRVFRDAVLEVLAPEGLGALDIPRGRLARVRSSLGGPILDPPGVPVRLAALARQMPERGAPAVFSIVSYLAWCRGEGALANLAVESALRLDPNYSLAMLIDRALRSAITPPKTREHSSTDSI